MLYIMIFEIYLFIYLFGHFDGLPIPPGYLMTFCYIKMMNIVNILKHFCIVIVSMFKVGNHKEMHLMFIYGHVSVHLMKVNTILPILLIAPLCSQACSCGVCLLIQQQQTKWATCQHATIMLCRPERNGKVCQCAWLWLDLKELSDIYSHLTDC